MKKVIITGSTGMVGRGVLLECLDDDRIDKVLIINRTKLQIKHPKLIEIILPDFENLNEILDKIGEYDACFYCMGVSAIGLTEQEYTRITLEITRIFIDNLYKINPLMNFIYVSGIGTDSSENGPIMWARIKGKTENYMFKKGFPKAYAFRPGFIIPERAIKSRTRWYNTIYQLLQPVFPLLKKMNSITTTTQIGKAMISLLFEENYPKKLLTNKDINYL